MNSPDLYIKRAFDLARLAYGHTAPNPMVGCVIVHNDRIIGEGYHQKYGGAHAEVNAVKSVSDHSLLASSQLYVSLEPCSIHGNTPPCTDLIIKHQIPEVTISCIDQTAGVNGEGIQRLKAAGVKVKTGVLKAAGERLSEDRNIFVSQSRPFILLKWAQSLDGFIGKNGQQLWLSNSISKRWTHKWRSESSAILVGTNTAVIDNPRLNNRLYIGPSPLRIALDLKQRIPADHHLLADGQATLVIGPPNPAAHQAVEFWQPKQLDRWLPELLAYLHQRKITSLMVEGGAFLLQFFLNNDCWDEARVLISDTYLNQGIPAPKVKGHLEAVHSITDNQLRVVRNVKNGQFRTS